MKEVLAAFLQVHKWPYKQISLDAGRIWKGVEDIASLVLRVVSSKLMLAEIFTIAKVAQIGRSWS